ncbi:polyketide cyclase, partial [Salmonella enterica subsp. enterica serovar Typhimurium]
VWTNAMLPGFRPAPPPATDHCGSFLFTAAVLMEAHGKGTRYTAMAIHRDEAARAQHEAMGFHEGWGKALDQLVELMQ